MQFQYTFQRILCHCKVCKCALQFYARRGINLAWNNARTLFYLRILITNASWSLSKCQLLVLQYAKTKARPRHHNQAKKKTKHNLQPEESVCPVTWVSTKAFFLLSTKSKFRRNFILFSSKFRCFDFPELKFRWQLGISISIVYFWRKFHSDFDEISMSKSTFYLGFDVEIGISISVSISTSEFRFWFRFRNRNFNSDIEVPIFRAGHIFFKISGPLILADFPLCEISGPKL
jgi:hypothetical protein